MLNKIAVIILTILFMISCTNSGKIERTSKPKNEITESKFKKVASQNSLNLKYQILDENDEQINFSCLIKPPEFPGGYDSLAHFIQKNFEFPKADFKKIEGVVKSTFVVDTVGKVIDVEVIERLRKDYDTASYQVISKIPNWKPAEKQHGKKVKIKFLLPLKFILTD